MTNFGHEYVWHCHILGHEENDMMRPIMFLGNRAIDFNGDANADILWRNTVTGQNMVWYMNGVTFTGSASIPALADTNWAIVGTGDFNSDGKTDILWRNTSTGGNYVWYMDGVTRIGGGTVSSPGRYQLGHCGHG